VRKVLTAFLIVVACGATAFGQTFVQVGTAKSISPFQLRQVTVAQDLGVPSWPVLAGDSIQAGKAPVLVTLNDGSTITLGANAEGRFGVADGKTVFQLLRGEAQYGLKAADSVVLMAGDKAITPATTSGGFGASGGFWTVGHTAIIATVAGGTGAALGVVSAVSPSR
jgi:hypothetical protein